LPPHTTFSYQLYDQQAQHVPHEKERQNYRKEHNNIHITAKSIQNKRVYETKIRKEGHKEPPVHQRKHLQMDHIHIFQTGNKTNHQSVLKTPT
jgi:hypothetical protein